MNQYEAMFLFDPTFGTTFENCEKEVHRLMERAEAEIIICRKWDERRLAYPIKGRKRGVFVLVYFKASADKIAPMERDAQLSEVILRLLVLRADALKLEHMEQMVPERVAEPAAAKDAPSEGASPKTETVAADSGAEKAATTETAVAEPPATETAVAEPEVVTEAEASSDSEKAAE